MDLVLQDSHCDFVYLDDILIASSLEKKHLEDLRIVFRRLTEQGLVIRLEKCLFGVPSLEFLGHQVSKNGSGPTQAKVEVIQNFPQPSTIKGLREFLGMINFYNRFCLTSPQSSALTTEHRRHRNLSKKYPGHIK